jgi:hypothetical protein
MTYLGIPVGSRKLSNSKWKPTEDKFEKKVGVWQGRLLILGGRLILTNTSLTNVPLYMLSLYMASKMVLKRMDYFSARLLWQDSEEDRKYHLVNWPDICRPKDQGGLGVLDLEVMNSCLLSKWFWRLENSTGSWQQIIEKKNTSKGLHLFWLKSKKR